MWLAAREMGELGRSSFLTIFRPSFRGPLAFISAMWLLQVVPLFAIYTYAPTVLRCLDLAARAPRAASPLRQRLPSARLPRCR